MMRYSKSARAALICASVLVAVLPALADPYGIEKRQMPDATKGESVLPPKVGSFLRGSVEGKLPADDVLASYRRKGSREIYVTAGLRDSAEDAQRAVREAAEMLAETYPGRRLPAASTDRDPAWFHYADPEIQVFYWSRGRWFFSVDASKSPGSLDPFVAAFPY